MATKKPLWKKGRGKLGLLDPLLGTWKATADTPLGPVACTRTLAKTLNGSYLELRAEWKFAKGSYLETALIGVRADGKLAFWSFTSDGKHSQGELADGSDVHPEAIAFVAQMPAGTARMVYWPEETGGFRWAVESKNRKGWKRFTEHRYSAQ
jgi:hypothetical protein